VHKSLIYRGLPAIGASVVSGQIRHFIDRCSQGSHIDVGVNTRNISRLVGDDFTGYHIGGAGAFEQRRGGVTQAMKAKIF
jgi:hypothetical protein